MRERRVVRDIARSVDWYGTVRGDDPGTPSILYFTVPDIHAAYEQLRARGVDFVGAPHLIFRHPPGVEEWMAFFTDPDDLPLALMCQVTPN